MTNRCVLRAVYLVVGLGLMNAFFAYAVPPPPAAPPVGWEEWQQTRQLPVRLFLPYQSGHAGVVMSTPARVHLVREPIGNGVATRPGAPDFPGFSVAPSPDAPSRRLVTITYSDRRPLSSSTHVETGYRFVRWPEPSYPAF